MARFRSRVQRRPCFGIAYWRLAEIEECWSARAANTG